jgi:hypothetical protein
MRTAFQGREEKEGQTVGRPSNCQENRGGQAKRQEERYKPAIAPWERVTAQRPKPDALMVDITTSQHLPSLMEAVTVSISAKRSTVYFDLELHRALRIKYELVFKKSVVRDLRDVPG